MFKELFGIVKTRNKYKRIEKLDSNLANNLALFSRGKLSLVESVTANAYHASDILMIYTYGSKKNYREDVPMIIICMMIFIYWQEVKDGLKKKGQYVQSSHISHILSNCIKFIILNNKDVKEYHLPEMKNFASRAIKKYVDMAWGGDKSVVDVAIQLLSNAYNGTKQFDVNEEEKLRFSLRLVEDKFRLALEDADSDIYRDMRFYSEVESKYMIYGI